MKTLLDSDRPPTPPSVLDLEAIFGAACDHYVTLARTFELDAMRHCEYARFPAATSSINQKGRAVLHEDSLNAAHRCRRLARICLHMREHAHGKVLSDMLSELKL